MLGIKAIIRTYTGEMVNVFRLDPDKVHIEDIAHSLSMQCRWGGHVNKFYSVAEHSIRCMMITSEVSRDTGDYKNHDTTRLQLTALMHDAAEAYLSDISSPLKKWMPFYRYFERQALRVLSGKFNFVYPFPKCIKMADKHYLAVEWEQLMTGKHEHRLQCWDNETAKEQFLIYFRMLTTGLEAGI